MMQTFRILVADDDPTVALLAQVALPPPRFAVCVVGDGLSAWKQFSAAPFDAVLLDVDMPEMDGFSVCAEIRRQHGSRVPVMLVSGHADATLAERADRLQAEYLIKPVDWSALADRVATLLGK